MIKKIIAISILVFTYATSYSQDYFRVLKSKTWYAIKIIKSDSGLSDSEFSPSKQAPYLISFKIEEFGKLIVNDTRTNDSKFHGKYVEKVKIDRKNFIITYTGDLTEEFEILECDEHFLKLRDSKSVVYYFISNSRKWEKKSRI